MQDQAESGTVSTAAALSASARRWAVILAVRPLAQAKSRLDLPAPARRKLAFAMLNDTLAAARSCRRVRHLVVVTADQELAATACLEGVQLLREATAEDLNGSFRAAAQQLRAVDGTLSIAFLPADLPAATAPELELALSRAERFPFAVLADSNGVGTVLLAVAAGTTASLRFGPRSFWAHRVAGAHPINERGLSGLRRDVDTLSDLILARRIGLGQHTGSVVDGLASSLRHRDHHIASDVAAEILNAGRP